MRKLKILLMSDFHIGITNQNIIENLLKKAVKEEKFDLVVYAGDYSGKTVGAAEVEKIAVLFNKYFEDKIVLSVCGNHDFWVGKKANLKKFIANQKKIEQIFKEHNIWYLDSRGLATLEIRDQTYQLFGTTGWYQFDNPPTNDSNFLPLDVPKGIHNYILQQQDEIFQQQLEQLRLAYEPSDKVIFVSHFPILNIGQDWKGDSKMFSWNWGYGNLLMEEFKGRITIIQGHSHKLLSGPICWESGSDYYRPAYIIVEV